MKIGIDLDEVLADFYQPLLNITTPPTKLLETRRFLSYGFEDACGKTEEEMVDDIHNFHQPVF